MGVFRMPSLGADMEDGVLVEWLVEPGQHVKRGDIVAVVETQKGAIEIEVFEDGVVESLDAELGRKLPVGAPLATIAANGKAAPEAAPTALAEQEPTLASDGSDQATEWPRSTAPTRGGQRSAPRLAAIGVAASPAARMAASERGLDLARIEGSGPHGAVLLRDIERSAEMTPPKTPVMPGRSGDKAGALAEMRKAIAAAMQRSKREIPHFQLVQTIDIQVASDWLASHNAGVPPDRRILMGALFMRAAALAAAEVKEMNGHYGPGGFVAAPEVNLGVAVALRGGGLIAPAIPRADTLALVDLMAAMRDLVARARAMRLRSSEMSSGTLTVSSLGESGADAMTGVIFPPQVALLAIGAPRLRPRVVDGSIVPRLTVTFTLSADHRVSDGRQANRFLSRLDSLLQTPEAL